MCKVINLFGEPGCGKSTLAAYIFYRLKTMGYNCELCDEFAKQLVYENNKFALSNQSYIFGQQLKKMNSLKNNVDIIITDSPLLLCGLYMKEEKLYNSFFNLVYDTFNEFDNYNFLLKRNHNYVQEGRYQTESEALEVRDSLMAELKHYKVKYTNVESTLSKRAIRNPAGEEIIKKVISDLNKYDLIPKR